MVGDRARGAARGNRWGLAAIGVLLLVIGAIAFAVGQGLFGAVADRTLLDEPVGPLLRHPWAPYVAVAVAVAAGFLALRWLLAQILADTVSKVRLDRTSEGVTDLSTSAAHGALEQEVTGYEGVRRARARLTESSTRPRLHLALTLDDDADVARVWRRVRDEALANLRCALELDGLPAVVRMKMTAPAKNPPRNLA